jgi:hypothetical protein
MIGLIGPEDSVELVMSVATEGGYADEIVPRSYTHADQAGAIARELDQICPVLLFTGRIPYLLAKESRQLNSELQFISHSGTDLYRCIARVLIDKHGIMPAVSIDTIEKSTVVSSFSEMGLPEPTVLLVDDAADAAASGGIHDVVNFHREQAESGRAAAAMTCLAEVSIELSKMKIPVWRVEHTKVNVRGSAKSATFGTTSAITVGSVGNCHLPNRQPVTEPGGHLRTRGGQTSRAPTTSRIGQEERWSRDRARSRRFLDHDESRRN